MSIESVIPSKHLILCRPLLPSSIFPSTRVFSKESVLCIRWPKYWSFSFSISPSNEFSGLISFRIDWFDLLAVQGTLRIFSNTIAQIMNSLALNFLYSGHRTGKGQFSFQSQRKAIPKNVQTTAKLHSSHTQLTHFLSKVMLKILQARLQ